MGCANNPQYEPKGIVVINEPPLSNDLDNTNFCSKPDTKQFEFSNCSAYNNNHLSFSSNSDSNVQTQKSVRHIFPSIGLLNEINKARTNPLSLIDRIEKLKKYVVTKNNRTFLYLNNNPQSSINLHKGISSFDNCIEYLKNLSQQTPPLKPLIMKEELKVPFPLNSPEICVNKDYLKNVLQFKAEENCGKLSINDFHYDICIADVGISALMQIIDDTGSDYQRRKNIFNKKTKYVGISEGIINHNMRCYYLLFAE
jgi:hypothetical protein